MSHLAEHESHTVTPRRASAPVVIGSKAKRRTSSGDFHGSTAELLVRQHLGDDHIDATPRSVDGKVFFDGKQARKNGAIATLAQNLVKQEAAAKIQKSFKRYRGQRLLSHTSFGRFGDEAVELIKRYQEQGGRLEEETFASKIRLILNFDVNKTVIMSDKAQSGDMSFIVNSLLSECAWGRLEAGPVWVPVGRLATDRPANDPRLMTYNSYLDSFLLPYDVGRFPGVEAKNAAIKKQRSALKQKFTLPGEPGAMFRGVYEKLCEELQLPPWHSRDNKLFSGGLTHIVPSFFNLLIHLQKEDRDFSIIFRTFGNDAEAICAEMNMFCTGQHPRYPNVRMDGSDGRTDLRLAKPDSLALYHRSSTKEEGSVLFVGADKLQMEQGPVDRATFIKMAETSDGTLLSGFKDISAHLVNQTTKMNRAYVIRDYYQFWKSRNERAHAGKLFLLDSRDKETLKVFFDDNIGHTSAHIVDARDVVTGQPLPFKKVEGKHLFKVEPLNAILDPHYFVRAAHECAVNWLKSREQNAPGQPADMPRVVQLQEPQARSVINTSRRARELWSILHVRIMAFVRMQHALRDHMA